MTRGAVTRKTKRVKTTFSVDVVTSALARAVAEFCCDSHAVFCLG